MANLNTRFLTCPYYYAPKISEEITNLLQHQRKPVNERHIVKMDYMLVLLAEKSTGMSHLKTPTFCVWRCLFCTWRSICILWVMLWWVTVLTSFRGSWHHL